MQDKTFSLLTVETSTEACSAALYAKGKVYSRYIVAPQQHAALILTLCQSLLEEAQITSSQLSGVAFGCGPGSFTGVRIATAVAQGIAIAHDLPVLPLSTLQILAQTAHALSGAKKIIAGIDARKQEIYLGKYVLENSTMQSVEEEKLVIHNISALMLEPDWFYAGSAFQKEEIIFPSADAMIPLALQAWQDKKFVLPENALPVYLRNKVTH